MLGIGPGELLLIFILALFVLGPERLPGVARDLGKVMAELRKASSELTDEFLKADQSPPPAPPASPPPAEVTPPAVTAESTAGQEHTEFDKQAQSDADHAREQARLSGAKPVPSAPPPPEPDRWG